MRVDKDFMNAKNSFRWVEQCNKGDEDCGLYLAKEIKDYRPLVDFIIKENSLVISEFDEQFWFKNDKQYLSIIKDLPKFVKRFIFNSFGNVSPSIIGNVCSYLEGYTPIKSMITYDLAISFSNGKTLDPKTMQDYIIPSDEFNPNIIPHRYLSEEEWTKKHYDKWEELQKILSGFVLEDLELQQELLEMIGYSMTRSVQQNKMFFITGNASNGKTTFLNLVIALLGKHNVSNIDIRGFTQDFHASGLYGKLANIVMDSSNEPIRDISKIKQITSGDIITDSFKGKDRFSFQPYAKLINGINEMFEAQDYGESNAMARRIKIMRFHGKYNTDKLSPEKRDYFSGLKRDKCLLEVLVTKSVEALNKALNSNFINSQNSIRNLASYQRDMSSVYEYLEHVTLKERMNTEVLFNKYKDFCAINDLEQIERRRDFNKKFMSFAQQIHNYDYFLDVDDDGKQWFVREE